MTFSPIGQVISCDRSDNDKIQAQEIDHIRQPFRLIGIKGGAGFPDRTAQKLQFLVQTLPIIRNAARPSEKHSPKLGQQAS